MRPSPPDREKTTEMTPKEVLRRIVPKKLLAERGIARRLGARAGRVYLGLRVLDTVGVRVLNQRHAPATSRSFLFVCFGNIMRSALAESIMWKAVGDVFPERPEDLQIVSAGLHAITGNEAHSWSRTAALDLGISLEQHRARLLTREMVDQADCILAMDFQNKAELLSQYPQANEKIFMLSAYAEGSWRNREIPDPYFGDVDVTRFCARQLQICIRNLIGETLAHERAHREAQHTA